MPYCLVLPDQLSDEIGPLAGDPTAPILMVESREYLSRRPYHRQRLAWIMGSMRHFAEEQRAKGRRVEYLRTDDPMVRALERWHRENGLTEPMLVMEPAEYEVRKELAELRGRIVAFRPHDGWLTTREEFFAAVGEAPPWRMDAFYREVRRRSGYLMDPKGKPVGGRFSFDGDNRKSWDGTPPAPDHLRFEPSHIMLEVVAEIEERYAAHPGKLDPTTIAASREQVERFWNWAKDQCLPHFGDYEDAMSTASTGLFHTRLSPLMNLHRLLPRRVVQESLALDIPFNGKEGFLRQIIGWREYVKHVHDASEGFRALPGGGVADAPGDGGFASWAGKKWSPAAQAPHGVDGGACDSVLEGDLPLPAAWWGKRSGLNCLDTVVASVWEEGWSHHITRLMVLSNIATLIGANTRELTDWFWIAYVDAWDWVVEPNVLGMGTFSVGELMTTKPYVGGAAYLDRMSNYCAECRFSPNGNCPLRRLYWAFLARHGAKFSENQRMWTVMNGLKKRSEEDRRLDAALYERVRARLGAGEELTKGDGG
jgi:deoxyribodipyrimidine photolyase-related protein